MANQQLVTSTPSGNPGRTFCLSEETQLIVHPRTAFKAPYITLSRTYPQRDVSRQVHVSMTGFVRLREKIGELKDAFAREQDGEWMLTRRQKVSISKYPKNGLMYTSFALIDRDTGEPDRTKTMNLGKEEFHKLVEIVDEVNTSLHHQLMHKRLVPGLPEVQLTLYRWRMQHTSGTVDTSVKVYLTRAECQEALNEILDDQAAQGSVPTVHEVVEESGVRPSQFKVIEMVLVILVRVFLRDKRTKNCAGCINEEANQMGHFDGCLMEQGTVSLTDVEEALAKIGRSKLVGIVNYVIRRMKYAAYVRDALEMFRYFDGLRKVADAANTDVRDTTLHSLVYDLTDEALVLTKEGDSCEPCI